MKKTGVAREMSRTACAGSRLPNKESPVNEALRAEREPLLVRVEDAAWMMSLSRSTVYLMMDRGVLPYVRYGTSRRIPTAAIRAWIAQNTINHGVQG